MNLLHNLKLIARNRIRNQIRSIDDLELFIKKWWSAKYQLPDNHPLLLEKTLEELLLDYFISMFENSPEEVTNFEKENHIEITDDDERWLKEKLGKEYDKQLKPKSDEFEEKF